MLDRVALVKRKLDEAMGTAVPSVLDVFKAPGKGFFQEKKVAFFKSDFFSAGNGRRNLDE